MGLFDIFFGNNNNNNDENTVTTPPTATSFSLLTELDKEIAELETKLSKAEQVKQSVNCELTTTKDILSAKKVVLATILNSQNAVSEKDQAQAQREVAKATQAYELAVLGVANADRTISDLKEQLTAKRAEKQFAIEAQQAEAKKNKQAEAAANTAEPPEPGTIVAAASTSNTDKGKEPELPPVPTEDSFEVQYAKARQDMENMQTALLHARQQVAHKIESVFKLQQQGEQPELAALATAEDEETIAKNAEKIALSNFERAETAFLALSKPQLKSDLLKAREQLQQYPYHMHIIEKLSAQYQTLISNANAGNLSQRYYLRDSMPLIVQTLSFMEQSIDGDQQHAVKKRIEELASTILVDYQAHVDTSVAENTDNTTYTSLNSSTNMAAALDNTDNMSTVEAADASSLDQLRDICQIETVQAEASLFKSEQTVIIGEIKDTIGNNIDAEITRIESLKDDQKTPAFFRLLNEFYLYDEVILAIRTDPKDPAEPKRHKENISKLHALAKTLGLFSDVEDLSRYSVVTGAITALGLSAPSATTNNPFGLLRTFGPNAKEVDLLKALHKYAVQGEAQALEARLHEKVASTDLTAKEIARQQAEATAAADAKKAEIDEEMSNNNDSVEAFNATIAVLKLDLQVASENIARYEEELTNLRQSGQEIDIRIIATKAKVLTLTSSEQEGTTPTSESSDLTQGNADQIAELKKELLDLESKNTTIENNIEAHTQSITEMGQAKLAIEKDMATAKESHTKIQAQLQEASTRKGQIDAELQQQLQDIASQVPETVRQAITEQVVQATQYAVQNNFSSVRDALKKLAANNPGSDQSPVHQALTHLIKANSFDLADMPAATSPSHGGASSSAATEPTTPDTLAKQLADEYIAHHRIADPRFIAMIKEAASSAFANINKGKGKQKDNNTLETNADSSLNSPQQVFQQKLAECLVDAHTQNGGEDDIVATEAAVMAVEKGTSTLAPFLAEALALQYAHSIGIDSNNADFPVIRVAAEEVIAKSSHKIAEVQKVYWRKVLVQSYQASHAINNDNAQMITLLKNVATEMVNQAGEHETLETLLAAFDTYVVAALSSDSNSNTAPATGSGAGASTSNAIKVSSSPATMFATSAATSSSSTPQLESAAVRANSESSSETPVGNDGTNLLLPSLDNK